MMHFWASCRFFLHSRQQGTAQWLVAVGFMSAHLLADVVQIRAQ
jgi:hypothetical protein